MSAPTLGDTASLLAGVPLFAGLDPDALRAVADATTVRRVEAGGVLFRRGDAGESLFLVRTGRVEVVVDGRVVRTHGPGEVFGELALLVDGHRSATVVARRDTELLALDRAGADRLFASAPTAVALLRRLAAQLAGTTPAPRSGASAVVALVPGHAGLPAAVVPALADRLLAALGGPTRVARLDAGDRPDGWSAALDRAEAAHARVLLVADVPDDDWARFCLRQADRPLVLVDARRGPVVSSEGVPRSSSTTPLPAGAQIVALTGAGATPPAWHAWLAGREAAGHHLLDPRLPADDVARLARRVSGRSLGLVLSGGGARGLAHIGLLEVLAREGLAVDRLGGTSMGAVVAGLAATGADAAEMVDVARRELVRSRPFRDPVWPRHALVRGRRLDRCLARVFGSARLEDQRASLFTVSTDLVAGRAVVHRRGPVAEAVALSVRLPGITPPRRIGPRLHVDGGVLDNLPIGAMADDGEGPVVACDVSPPFDDGPLAGERRRLPHIVDTIGRSMTLASWNRGLADRPRAHTVVTPALDGVGLFDFARVDELVDAGRRAAEDALPRIRAAVAS